MNTRRTFFKRLAGLFGPLLPEEECVAYDTNPDDIEPFEIVTDEDGQSHIKGVWSGLSYRFVKPTGPTLGRVYLKRMQTRTCVKDIY